MPEDTDNCPSCQDLPGSPVPGQEDVYAFAMPMPPDDQLTPWQAMQPAAKPHAATWGTHGTRPTAQTPWPESLFDIEAAPEPGPAMATQPRREGLPPLNAPDHQWPIQQQVQQPHPMASVIQDPHDPSVTFHPRLGAPWSDIALQKPPPPGLREPEPEPPSEPASEEDCDKWMQEYLEWLDEHGGLKEQKLIIVRCNNKRYIFKYVEDAPGYWKWRAASRNSLDDLVAALADQRGPAAPTDSWSDPADTKDFDELWEDPEAQAERDGQGVVVKKLLGVPSDCGLAKVRIHVPASWTITQTFAFEYTYIIPAQGAAPDAQMLKHFLDSQQLHFSALLQLLADEDSGTESIGAILASISGILLPLALVRPYFTCEPPCRLRVNVVGWTNLTTTPLEPDSTSPRVEEATRAVTSLAKGRYYEVKIRSSGTVRRRATANLIIDAFCVSG